MITIEKYSPERHEQTCELSVLEEHRSLRSRMWVKCLHVLNPQSFRI